MRVRKRREQAYSAYDDIVNPLSLRVAKLVPGRHFKDLGHGAFFSQEGVREVERGISLYPVVCGRIDVAHTALSQLCTHPNQLTRQAAKKALTSVQQARARLGAVARGGNLGDIQIPFSDRLLASPFATKAVVGISVLAAMGLTLFIDSLYKKLTSTELVWRGTVQRDQDGNPIMKSGPGFSAPTMFVIGVAAFIAAKHISDQLLGRYAKVRIKAAKLGITDIDHQIKELQGKKKAWQAYSNEIEKLYESLGTLGGGPGVRSLVGSLFGKKGGKGTSSGPEKLRQAVLSALKKDDPRDAYSAADLASIDRALAALSHSSVRPGDTKYKSTLRGLILLSGAVNIAWAAIKNPSDYTVKIGEPGSSFPSLDETLAVLYRALDSDTPRPIVNGTRTLLESLRSEAFAARGAGRARSGVSLGDLPAMAFAKTLSARTQSLWRNMSEPITEYLKEGGASLWVASAPWFIDFISKL